ncbi:glycerate kinase [Paenibacillus cremeus]|uniref:Glycerate kinase n=1 Tax=Paenibacillus cremeus TaxID=2163881 RepID=A0A559K5G1_9BACL|nr:glycerate kinase [Paenibacillus cremeus]
MTNLNRHIAEEDWVITGEGCSDRQTLLGKLPYHVAHLSKKAGKEAILYFAGCFSIVIGPSTLETVLEEAKYNLFECIKPLCTKALAPVDMLAYLKCEPY